MCVVRMRRRLAAARSPSPTLAGMRHGRAPHGCKASGGSAHGAGFDVRQAACARFGRGAELLGARPQSHSPPQVPRRHVRVLRKGARRPPRRCFGGRWGGRSGLRGLAGVGTPAVEREAGSKTRTHRVLAMPVTFRLRDLADLGWLLEPSERRPAHWMHPHRRRRAGRDGFQPWMRGSIEASAILFRPHPPVAVASFGHKRAAPALGGVTGATGSSKRELRCLQIGRR